jgi:hypothetical protein
MVLLSGMSRRGEAGQGGCVMRVTRKQLRQKVGMFQSDGIDIAIGWAMGQARCTNKSESRDISPRLSTGDMSIWLQGFYEGMKAVHDRIAELEGL